MGEKGIDEDIESCCASIGSCTSRLVNADNVGSIATYPDL